MDDDDFAKSLDMNLWTAARVAQRAVPHLIARGGGSITMISSIWGREAGGAPGYNVAKAGVIALAKALARDYAKHGIRVNSVAPGSILFPGGGWDRRQKADPDGIADIRRARAAVRPVRHARGGRRRRHVRRVAARELDRGRVHPRRRRPVARVLTPSYLFRSLGYRTKKRATNFGSSCARLPALSWMMRPCEVQLAVALVARSRTRT